MDFENGRRHDFIRFTLETRSLPLPDYIRLAFPNLNYLQLLENFRRGV